MPLYIPAQDRALLLEMSNFTDQRVAEFLDAVRNASPRLRIADFAAGAAARSKIEERKLAAYLNVLANLSYAKRDARLSLAAILDEVESQLQSGDNSKKLRFEVVRELAREALALDSAFGKSVKAYEVLTEAERLFTEARVLTDLRHVFSDDNVDSPLAAVVVHSLRITYGSRAKRDSEDCFVEMDMTDLRELRAAIDRAIAKEEMLIKAYQKQIEIVGM